MTNRTSTNVKETVRPSTPFPTRAAKHPVRYSLPFKHRAVREFLGGEKKADVCEKYSITRSTMDCFLRECREEVQQEMERGGEYIHPRPAHPIYEKSFKIQCVRLVLSGERAQDVGRRYGVHCTTVRDWVCKYGEAVSQGLDLAPSHTTTSGPASVELRRPEPKPLSTPSTDLLSARCAQLEEENRILRKTIAIFASNIA